MKKALISASLLFLFSLTMLFGSTYAWWSEDIAVRNNEIRMGNLDVKADIADPLVPERWFDLETVPSRSIFEVVRLEPGSTAERLVKVTNTGSIPLAYRFVIDAPIVDPNFNSFVKFSGELLGTNYSTYNYPVSMQAFNPNHFIVLQPGESHIFKVRLHINEDLGNADGMFGENQIMKFVVTLQARQLGEVRSMTNFKLWDLVDGVFEDVTNQ